MNEIIRKFVITILSYINHYFHRKKSNIDKDERILIVSAGVLGDGILFLDALTHLVEYYSKSDYRILLVCRNNMKDLYNQVLKESVDIIDLEMDGKWPTINAYLSAINTIGQYRIKQSYVVMHHAWGHMINYSIGKNESYFLCYRDWYEGRKWCLKYIIKTHYCYVHYVTDSTFLPEAYKELIKSVLGYDYRTRNVLLSMPDSLNGDICNYMILAPMANVTDRNLSIEQIQGIIQYILEHKDYNIIITGREHDIEYIDSAIEKFESTRVFNYCGKTSFQEFNDLIRGAYYLLGTDSGHIHLASVQGVPSICLVGWWHVGQFLPYKYDLPSEKDPICIYSKKNYSCKNCQAIYGKEGNGKMNAECGERIKRKLSNLCLFQIEMDNVYDAIERMDKYVIKNE